MIKPLYKVQLDGPMLDDSSSTILMSVRDLELELAGFTLDNEDRDNEYLNHREELIRGFLAKIAKQTNAFILSLKD